MNVDTLASEVSSARLMASVEKLCSIGEKVSGTDEERLACEYLTGQLTEYGVTWQVHEFEAFISFPGETAVHVLADQPLKLAAAGVAFARDTACEGIEAELVWAGSGKDADCAGLDAAGKIVLVSTLPEAGVCAAARRAGAVGLIGASSGAQRHKMTCSPVWGSPANAVEQGRIPDIAAASVSRPDLELLRARLAHQATRVRLVAPVDTGWRRVRLPVAEISGTEPGFLLAGAHYCTWYDGATDNVAANAILLELARTFAGSKPRYGLRLAWWPGHSQGRYAGSAWYADEFWRELHARCIGYLNIDINGSRGGVNKSLRNVTAELEKYAIDAIAAEMGPVDDARQRSIDSMLQRPGKYVSRKRPHRASDQSFLGIGLSALQVSSLLGEDDPDRVPGTGLPRWWHAEEDVSGMVDPRVITEDAKIHVRLVHGLVKAKTLPLSLEAVAEDFAAVLRELQDVVPKLPLLAEVETGVEAFREQARRFTAARSTMPGAAFDRTVLGVLRLLTPVLYTLRSAFEPDPAVALRLLPALTEVLSLTNLAADDAAQSRIRLRRACNRITHALDGATASLQANCPPTHFQGS